MSNNKEKSVYKFRNPTDLTNIVVFLFYVYLLATAVMMISGIFQYNLILDMKQGALVTEEAIALNDQRQSNLYGMWLIFYILTGIFYFIWLERVASNAKSFHPVNSTLWPGCSFIWYFMPLVSFYVPYQDMQQLYKISKNPQNWKDEMSSVPIKWWWFLWISSILILYVSGNSIEKAKDIDFLLNSLLFNLLGLSGNFVCAILLMQIVKDICKKQKHTCKTLRAIVIERRNKDLNNSENLRENEDMNTEIYKKTE